MNKTPRESVLKTMRLRCVSYPSRFDLSLASAGQSTESSLLCALRPELEPIFLLQLSLPSADQKHKEQPSLCFSPRTLADLRATPALACSSSHHGPPDRSPTWTGSSNPTQARFAPFHPLSASFSHRHLLLTLSFDRFANNVEYRPFVKQSEYSKC